MEKVTPQEQAHYENRATQLLDKARKVDIVFCDYEGRVTERATVLDWQYWYLVKIQDERIRYAKASFRGAGREPSRFVKGQTRKFS